MKKRLRGTYGCPVELAVDVLGGKWKTVILCHLKEGHGLYGELRRLTPGMSDKVLTQKLQELEALGLIDRTTDGDGRSRYRLTTRGEQMRPALSELFRLGAELAPVFGVRVDGVP